MRRVPLARRNLLADWRRLVISVLGVGVALMLILLLDGLWLPSPDCPSKS